MWFHTNVTELLLSTMIANVNVLFVCKITFKCWETSAQQLLH